ncbi:MAG: hypothetical protein IR526_02575 [Bordetella sp.]|nr:MAG: hypothetical protein IR526_02575 [Bordetella sp.]
MPKNSAIENSEAITSLLKDGIAIYPGDDPYTKIWEQAQAKHCKSIKFGFDQNLEVYAKSIIVEFNRIKCEIVSPSDKKKICLNLLGSHNLRNALAAVSTALAINIPLSNSIQVLSNFKSVSGRMECKHLNNGNLLIDDTYNANPDSVRVAIDVLSKQLHPQVFILGDMAELGIYALDLYKEIGIYAFNSGIDCLITFGQDSKNAIPTFWNKSYICFSIQEIIDILHVLKPSTILVKGSRFMRMERVIKHILEKNI